MLQVLPESENREEVEVLFQSGLEQYKESQSKPDETEPVPSTVSFNLINIVTTNLIVKLLTMVTTYLVVSLIPWNHLQKSSVCNHLIVFILL